MVHDVFKCNDRWCGLSMESEVFVVVNRLGEIVEYGGNARIFTMADAAHAELSWLNESHPLGAPHAVAPGDMSYRFDGPGPTRPPTGRVSVRMNSDHPSGTTVEVGGRRLACHYIYISHTATDGEFPTPVADLRVVVMDFEGELDAVMSTELEGKEFLVVDPDLYEVRRREGTVA
jgi:hypothetical protein